MPNWIELAELAAEIPVAKKRSEKNKGLLICKVTEQQKATGAPQLRPRAIWNTIKLCSA